jgi:regulator of CtrA degradation
MTRRVIDSLHIEAMVLADEARAYFDGLSRDDTPILERTDRVVLSCEALKVTTRLMHCIAWLLSHRARLSGDNLMQRPIKLGTASETSPETITRLPPEAAKIVTASQHLYARIHRVNDGLIQKADEAANPAHRLLHRLERVF